MMGSVGSGPGRDGFDPIPYRVFGFPSVEAREWWKRSIPAKDADRWRSVGVHLPVRAAQWTAAGITPDTVGDWLANGFEADEVVHWHEFGFGFEAALDNKRAGKTPEQAFEELRGGARAVSGGHATPGEDIGGFFGFDDGGSQQKHADDAQRFVRAVRGAKSDLLLGYITRQWLNDEAIAWASLGIDIASAFAWKELGIKPSEAARFVRQNRTPMMVAMEWWRAGVPVEEVAAWIGAGLTAAEAVEQRDHGVTAEQAEVLRSLQSKDKGNEGR